MRGDFNPCMKTGLWFAFSRRGDVYTGDLFLQPEGLQIKGVPPGTVGNVEPDVIIAPCDFMPREYNGSPYRDSEPGHVQIRECSDAFRAHVLEWSPAMLGYLPAKVES